MAGVASLVEAFHLPALGNTNAYLGVLRERGFVERYGGAAPWALTPLGEGRVSEMVGDLPLATVEAELADAPGALLADVSHRVIPPTLAPPRWAEGISRLLKRFPFETNVFCMTRFPGKNADPAADPVAPLVPRLREVVGAHGLSLHLASDRQIDDDLLGNVGAYMWACQYGIGILEDRAGKGLNYNVVIELGAMIVTGRRCALMKDVTAPTLPTDFVGQIYKPVDLSDADGVADRVDKWIKEDLAL